ncbi:DUF2935 domain-containing protein [Paenibacillus rigui]|uniref:DUF2935 domain-containing protein n=1 Tax=Paenibacillus rigui TaxID=554312 RepID=A0A229UKI2_9BACL|nr:DUF2935 domain-containing protein [Paenibacillus rigui]OXM83881.1 hypothetical protein CF651_23505 [Paenibacillus rigui]
MNQGAQFEHRFWLQILGDHSRFIWSTLSPKEDRAIQIAHQFIQSFDSLLELARKSLTDEELMSLNQQALSLTIQLRSFKLDLLKQMLTRNVSIGLTPTFINHMVNELEEYLRIVNELAAGRPVPHFDAIHHDLLWLSDASGHAASIASDLDMVEKRLMEKSQMFEVHFQQFYIKSIEMAGYMRTQLSDFPAFRKFHKDIDIEMKLFVAFLQEIEDLELSVEVLDRISPLIPDHMMREECYYLTKLAGLGMVPNPNCDPTKPRVES